jgi:VWFA-related protein
MLRSFVHLLPAILLASTASAQTAAPSEPTFFESIDVNLANVEVYVTDRQGHRVPGLAREDFEVLEDGKPVAITNFYTVSEGQAATPPEAAEEEPARISAIPPPPTPPDTQRLYLTIFLDNRTLVPATRNRLLEEVEDFVSHLRPEDRILLATYDGSMRIRQGLTNDPATLTAALEEMARVAPGGVSRDAERRRMMRQIEMATPVDSEQGGESQLAQAAIILGEQLYQEVRSYGLQQLDETRVGLLAVKELVDALAGLPGRKAVLYVSGGVQLRPAEALMRAWETKFSALRDNVGFSSFDGRRDDATPLLRDLVDHANANRVTFYTLGATAELAGVSAEASAGVAFTSELEGIERMNLQSSLQIIADGTGGLAGVDGPVRSLLDRMREDFDTFYSLGYVPANGRDGKKRKVEVRTRDRSLEVRYREARTERTERERMTSRALSALVLGEDDNPLEIAVELGREKKNDKGQYEVEVLIKFPLAKLVLAPQDQFHEGRLTLFVGARDSHGRSSAIQEIDVPIRVPNDQLLTALGQVGAYRMTLLLRPEPHTVAVAVRDRLGNVDSTARAEYVPGAAEHEGVPGG